MGKDMHCAVEAHNKKTDKWECFGVSHSQRIYELFSRIADVCNSEDEKEYIEPIDNPRGFPENVTEAALVWDDYNLITFSHTWLERTELESLNKWVQERFNNNLWDIKMYNDLKGLVIHNLDTKEEVDMAAFFEAMDNGEIIIDSRNMTDKDFQDISAAIAEHKAMQANKIAEADLV